MENLPLPKVMDLLLDTVCVVDEYGRYIYVSASMEQLLGYRPEELLGQNMIDLVHPEDRERTLNAAGEIMSGQPKAHFQNRYLHRDGRVIDIMWSARWSDDDRLRLAVARDITALKRAERMQAALYRISEAAHLADGLPALYERIHQIISELLPVETFCVVRLDSENQTLSTSYCSGPQACAYDSLALNSDSPTARVISSGRTILIAGNADSDGRSWLGVPLTADQSVVGALVLESPAGGTQYAAHDQDLLQFVSTQVASAIERKQAEARLSYMARHDPLTGLPNRALFQDRMDVALRRAQRDQEYAGLLYLDLNDFKQINDSFGHAVGDGVLKDIARRLLECVRKSDTVARMGGDEFTILLANLSTPDDIGGVVEKVRDAVAAPLTLEDGVVNLSASVGASVYPANGRTSEELLQYADTGMYAEKRQRNS